MSFRAPASSRPSVHAPSPRPAAVAFAPRASAARRATRSPRAMGQPSMPAPAGVKEILLSEEDIRDRVREIGRQIAIDYADKSPLVVSTLKGAVIFTADLVRAISPVPPGLTLDFVRASSYGSGTVSSGKVNITGDRDDVRGRHVILVEDIVDTGNTAAALLKCYRELGCASVQLASLLSKPSRRETTEGEPAYLCFEVPDKFVVGYGLDYDERYRSLPYVGVLDESAI